MYVYGFGDEQAPYTESVDVTDKLVGSSSLRITHKTMPTGGQIQVQIVCLKRTQGSLLELQT